MREATQAPIQQALEAENVDQGSQEDQGVDHRKILDLEAPDPAEVDPRWTHAHRSFSLLKTKIASTPVLRHFNPNRRATVVVNASDWAISGSLMEEYAQIYYPVIRMNYGITEKEVLAVLRILDLNYNALVGRPIHVLTRHSTLAWLFRSTALQGRLGQWAALLLPWILEITKCAKGEDEILGSLAASITPRSEVDKALISIAPKKEPRRKIQAPILIIGCDEDLYVISFDGSARAKRGYAEGLTVNEAEYHGLLLCLDRLEDLNPRRLVICGDSNLVIQQVRGEIDCKAPGLTLLRQRALDRHNTWPDHELLHVIAKASASRSGQTIADTYEECVFRRFGASKVIRHDREPGFMSDFFKSFNKILGQRQRATIAYRPQANGSAGRMVQTTTRALKMYVQDLDQRDWDEYAERLTFAINMQEIGSEVKPLSTYIYHNLIGPGTFDRWLRGLTYP
ncbi:reverse transcriptase [Phytophthora megakarya]|uniref:Reverse transcriptase n=1 Tax=Phytophthora megakarya TaxID=4795 RepID=A0A225VLH9_9STRA|nr:reverse transcriptase [Phytophthora megakarya]